MHTLYLFFITVPLTAVVVGLFVTMGRNVGRLWLDHRVKLALLEKLESKPHLLRSFDELESLLDDTPKYEAENVRLNYLVTGVVLALTGIACIAVAAPIPGRTAVGVYVGGVASVAFGFLLTLVGLLTWFLSRSPVSQIGEMRSWHKRFFRSRR